MPFKLWLSNFSWNKNESKVMQKVQFLYWFSFLLQTNNINYFQYYRFIFSLIFVQNKRTRFIRFKITLIPIKQFTNRTIARTIFSITKNQHNNQFYDWPQIIPMQFVLRLQSVWLATFCKYEIIQIEIPASLHSTPTLMLIQKCNDVT